MKINTTVYALKCPKCNDVVFSRANHDFNSCTCGTISVDGGFNFQRMAFDPKFIQDPDKDILRLKLSIPASAEELYSDWNKSIDKWGRHNYYDIVQYIQEVK